MRKVLIIISILLSLQVFAESPPYILYRQGAPGVVQYWFYDVDGTVIPLLEHQLKNKQYNNYKIITKRYRHWG